MVHISGVVQRISEAFQEFSKGFTDVSGDFMEFRGVTGSAREIHRYSRGLLGRFICEPGVLKVDLGLSEGLRLKTPGCLEV